jgi:hypothetical protein
MTACTQEHHPNRPNNIARTAVTQRSAMTITWTCTPCMARTSTSIPSGAARPIAHAALLKRKRGHEHGPGCGHLGIPHGDHLDYLVNGRYTIHMAIVATTQGRVHGTQPRAAMGQTKRVRSCGRLS